MATRGTLPWITSRGFLLSRRRVSGQATLGVQHHQGAGRGDLGGAADRRLAGAVAANDDAVVAAQPVYVAVQVTHHQVVALDGRRGQPAAGQGFAVERSLDYFPPTFKDQEPGARETMMEKIKSNSPVSCKMPDI